MPLKIGHAHRGSIVNLLSAMRIDFTDSRMIFAALLALIGAGTISSADASEFGSPRVIDNSHVLIVEKSSLNEYGPLAKYTRHKHRDSIREIMALKDSVLHSKASSMMILSKPESERIATIGSNGEDVLFGDTKSAEVTFGNTVITSELSERSNLIANESLSLRGVDAVNDAVISYEFNPAIATSAARNDKLSHSEVLAEESQGITTLTRKLTGTITGAAAEIAPTLDSLQSKANTEVFPNGKAYFGTTYVLTELGEGKTAPSGTTTISYCGKQYYYTTPTTLTTEKANMLSYLSGSTVDAMTTTGATQHTTLLILQNFRQVFMI